MKNIKILLRITAASLFLIPVACVTVGDYGDAPDSGPTGYPPLFAQSGQFPTLFASNGAVADDLGEAILGPGSSAEENANDPVDPDGQPNLNPTNTDSDDGIVDFIVLLVSIPPPAIMTVNVTGPPGSPGGTYWINVLIDLNMDGQWGGIVGPGLVEWAVQNFPVVVSPGVTTQVALPPFYFANGNRLPDGAWMRIVLSNEFIGDPDWDGSGDFAAGEVEDHVISLPDVNGKNIVIQMSCPNRVLLPADGSPVLFACNVTNMGSDPGTFRYLLNGIFRGPSVQVTPIGIASIGVIPPVPPPGGPIRSGPIAIGPPPPPPVVLTYIAKKLDDLPSDWIYQAWAVDPPAVVSPEGVTIGYGSSFGNTQFVDTDLEYLEANIVLEEDIILIEMQASDSRIQTPVKVAIQPGESFRGMSYNELRARGEGPINLQ